MAQKSKQLTTREFSEQTGLSVSTVTQMIRQGKIEAVKSGGRWYIAAAQLDNPAVRNAAGPKTGGAKKKSTAAAAGAADRLSVSDFAGRTYLTEAGVVQYLRQGRLQGGQDESGQWWVDSANLEHPAMQHLLRPDAS